jgi:hypothetical protein
MSLASLEHSLLKGRLALFDNQIGSEGFTELAVQTAKGMRLPDVAWESLGYVQKHIKDIYALH